MNRDRKQEVTHAFFVLIGQLQIRTHSHYTLPSMPRPTQHCFQLNRCLATTSTSAVMTVRGLCQFDGTDAAAAVEAVFSVGKLNPTLSGRLRRAWSKLGQVPALTGHRRSARQSVLHRLCSYNDESGESDPIPAHSSRGSVRESGPHRLRMLRTAVKGTQPIVGRIARK